MKSDHMPKIPEHAKMTVFHAQTARVCPGCHDDGGPCAVCKPDSESVLPEEEFDALVESMIGALQLDEEESEDARNHPLINLPGSANEMANRLRRAEEANNNLRDAIARSLDDVTMERMVGRLRAALAATPEKR